jgi:uncharacterized delta-60 repeat protein
VPPTAFSSHVTVEPLEPRALLSGPPAGALDPAFAARGTLVLGADSAHPATALAVQSDGRIVVAGGDAGALSVARYNADGTPDASFGAAGRVVIDPTPDNDAATAVALAPDGSILVAATGTTSSPGQSSATLVLARFTPSGQPDPTFGTAGVALHHYFPGSRPPSLFPSSLVVQPDGKALVAGTRHDITFPESWVFLHRYNINGTADASFGTAGVADAYFPGAGIETDPSVGVQPDGRIVLVTAVGDDRFGPNRAGVRRYDATGQLDPSYPPTEVPQFIPTDAAFAADGRVVVAGSNWANDPPRKDVAVLSLNPDGSRDAGFGNNGLRSTNLGSSTLGSRTEDNFDTAESVALDSAGDVVVAATTYFEFRDQAANVLLRYDPRGNLDRRIGGPSGILGPVTTQHDRNIADMAVAPDGGVLLLSSVVEENSPTFELTRHLPRGADQPPPIGKVTRHTLRVRGTRGDDVIHVDTDPSTSELVVTVNGVSRRFPAASVRRIVLSGGRGNDDLTITPATSIPATLRGGPGTDTAHGNPKGRFRSVESRQPAG